MNDRLRAHEGGTPGSERAGHLPGASSCELCGLPAGASPITMEVNGKTVPFCCHGCRQVFQILFNDPTLGDQEYRKTDIYRACVAAGLIPGSVDDLPEHVQGPDPAATASGGGHPFEKELSREVTLHIGGMWCTACSWLIEEVLKRIDGVLEARVLFLSDTATVSYLPHRVDVETLQKAVARVGYRADRRRVRATEAAREKREWLKRFGIAAIFTCNIMLISFVLYWGFFRELEAEGISLLSYLLWAMATPVVFYSGRPILTRAAAGLRHMKPTMETLIAVGSLAAYFYSVVEIYLGGMHLYFDTASMLVTLVLLGKFIETHARERVSRGIQELFQWSSGKIRLCTAPREQWVTARAARVGDEFTLEPGWRFPLDGVVVEGRALVDQSFLTGESRPVTRGPGDDVHAGSLLLEGRPRLRVTRKEKESALGRMIALMEEALGNKDPFELLADRLTRVLVPAILLLAACTALVLLHTGHPAEEAFLRAVTVLVITCPCALGIATPLAKVAAIEKGRAQGILVRNAAALERLQDLDVLVFDKTGTVTEGVFVLRHHVSLRSAPLEDLGKVASLEVHSDHFLAGELVRRARDEGLQPGEVSHLESLEGMGIRGVVDGEEVMAGNRAALAAAGIRIPPELEEQAAGHEKAGLTVVFYARGGEAAGCFALGDRVRERAPLVMEELTRQGVEVHLLSGDSPHTTSVIAGLLGIRSFQGGALPHDKVRRVKELQERGCLVGMVGDGVNDAGALAQAHVGIAVAGSAGLLRDASDITLMSGEPEKLPAAIGLSRLTTRVIRQNLFFAFLYNALGIPLAAAGLLNPLVAVLAMFASSLSVIGNTLRITAGAGERRDDTPT